MSTPDNVVAEQIGRAIDGKIFRLQEERRSLLAAAARILAIDAELVILQSEKARIDPRRPLPIQTPTTPLTETLPTRTP